jgi:hypothetical protein
MPFIGGNGWLLLIAVPAGFSILLMWLPWDYIPAWRGYAVFAWSWMASGLVIGQDILHYSKGIAASLVQTAWAPIALLVWQVWLWRKPVSTKKN